MHNNHTHQTSSIWFGIPFVYARDIRLPEVMDPVSHHQTVFKLFVSVVIVLINTHTRCLWLQICGAVCSHPIVLFLGETALYLLSCCRHVSLWLEQLFKTDEAGAVSGQGLYLLITTPSNLHSTSPGPLALCLCTYVHHNSVHNTQAPLWTVYYSPYLVENSSQRKG